MLNEARILGDRVEARSAARRAAGKRPVAEGMLVKGGTVSGGGVRYRLASDQIGKAAPTLGPRVRFAMPNLGASAPQTLFCATGDLYGPEDEGVVAFAHPNSKMCPDWYYVEVDSKIGEPRKLYVGAPRDWLVEVVDGNTMIRIVDAQSGAVDATCTVDEFFSDNDGIDPEEEAEMRVALATTGHVTMGGGAAPLVRVEVVS